MPLSIRSSGVPFDLSPVILLLGVGIWLAATALTVAVAALIVVRLPPTYFSEDAATHAARLAPWRSARALAQNALGLVLIAVGLVMSVPGIPGQGLLTVLIGLMLVDFPGRRRLERALARRRGLLAFADARSPLSLITRGPMIVRDLDVLRRAATSAEVDVTFSIPTLDLDIWRRTEPGTAPPRQRLRALRMLIDAGIDTGVGIAPILPGISDRPELLADVVKAARDAGATNVWCNVLYLQPGTREHFMEHLARDWPELVPSYLALYRHPYPERATTEPIKSAVAALKKRFDVADRRARPLEPRPGAEQLALAI